MASLGKRLLLLSAASVAAVVVGDLLFRWAGPVLAYDKGGFIKTPQGYEVPLAEIYSFNARRGELYEGGDGPSGRLQPGLSLRIGYQQPQWDYFDEHGCIAVKNNSLGFRDEEFPVAKPPGEFRVIALGDSFTYGVGVQQPDVWPEVLEDRLRTASGGPAQVINAGMACGNGARSAAEYAPWMASDGFGFAPDLVVLGFCLNDISDAVPMLGYEPPEYEPVLGGVWRMLDFAVHAVRTRTAAQRQTTLDIAGVLTRDAARWQRVQDGMATIRDLCADRGVPFVVAVFPMISQLDGPYPYGALHEAVHACCERLEIPYVDLLDDFRGRADQDLWVHPTDQHPNDLGHRIIAERIFAFLRARGLVPAGS